MRVLIKSRKEREKMSKMPFAENTMQINITEYGYTFAMLLQSK